MEFDFWWLPGAALFFVLGWLASRKEREQPSQTESSSQNLPQAYLRGLNFVLKEEPQRAIDTFTELIRQEPDRVELHFALGQLFRRRGETDRAIRVHQDLLQRQPLSESDRERARFAIAQDYFRAGLYDHADTELRQLAGSGHAAEAFDLRLDIAQRLRDWDKALTLLDDAQPAAASAEHEQARLALRAHLHCELALEHQARKDNRSALAELLKASTIAPDHPRAFLALGALHAQIGQCRQALSYGEAVLVRWPGFATAIAVWWLACHARRKAQSSVSASGDRRPSGALEALDALDTIDTVDPLDTVDARDTGDARDALEALKMAMQKAPSADLLGIILRAVEERDGAQAALALARSEALRAPNPRNLLELLGRLEPEDRSTEPMEAVRMFLEGLAPSSGRLACVRCGFQSARHVWQCAGCNRWDTYPAIPGNGIGT